MSRVGPLTLAGVQGGPAVMAWCACAALGCLLPAAARADAASQGEARVDVFSPATLIGAEDMDFGSITPRGTAGTIVLSASASATCTVSGTMLRAGTCRAATFDGDVSQFYLLRVRKPLGGQIALGGPGGATMRLDAFTFGAGPGLLNLGGNAAEHRFFILNADGSFTFFVGGRLAVAGDQAPGRYYGTFEIELNYD